MRLKELLKFDRIVVQCHDNPDADAIASGFGICAYLESRGKQVRFIYGGRYRIQKSNLVLMISELEIPLEYVEELEPPDLLITVDCQYGEGNVTRFEAGKVAVIDHHQVSGQLPGLHEVRSNLGACSTVVWDLLDAEGFDVNRDRKLATALYYGLLTDTNNFTEVSHPLDKDLRDDALFERSLVTRFRNANLSLEELEIAGMALMGYSYQEAYRYAVAEAKPCDPNILGMISDLMLEVDAVDTCLVYSVHPFGVKLSVRSCVREVKACEMAEFITQGIGSGGGHQEKAGGFIQMELLEKAFRSWGRDRDVKGFLKWRMDSYFDGIEVIHSAKYAASLEGMELYRKRRLPLGFVEAAEIFPVGTTICVRTLEGDLDVEVQENTFIMIGVKGEVYPSKREKFQHNYVVLEEPYEFQGEYAPAVRDLVEGRHISLIPHARACLATGESYIYVKELDHRVKVFTEWDDDKYMLGKEGDFLAVRQDDLHDIYVIEQSIFERTYEKAKMLKTG